MRSRPAVLKRCAKRAEGRRWWSSRYRKCRECSNSGDQIDYFSAAHQRLSARDSHLPQSAKSQETNNPQNLGHGQDVGPGLVWHAVFRHAIDAAQIASVSNTDSQILDSAAK